jgi:hypothetical protein
MIYTGRQITAVQSEIMQPGTYFAQTVGADFSSFDIENLDGYFGGMG